MNFKRIDRYASLSNLSIYYTQKNIEKSNKDNKFKFFETTWDEAFELPDGPDCFKI